MIAAITLLVYLVVINVIGFLAFGIDKHRSVRSKWRIPETTLFSIAVLFGSIGCMLGMKVFRHKTKKLYFVYGIPAIFLFQVVLILIILFLTPLSFKFL